MKRPTLKPPPLTLKKSDLLQYFIVFLTPLCIVLLTLRAKGIAPFGGNCLLTMDLWGQYFPMYLQQANTESLQELFFSWEGGLGYNNLAQTAYYCNSIFHVLFRFCAPDNMLTMLSWICTLRVALSAVTSFAFLRYKLRSDSLLLMPCAVCYALCGYAIAYISQTMWTDSLIYLPLLLIGLERLLNQKKPLLYTLMLALTIFSSFYIGFSICIFLVLYVIFEFARTVQFRKAKFGFAPTELRQHLGKLLRFGAFSLLGAGLTAFTLLPVQQAINLTVAKELSAPSEVKWYNTLLEYFGALLPSTPPSVSYGVPNLSTGLFLFLLVPLYFFNRRIKFREKVTSLVFLAIFYCSMNLNLLNYVWHGFHFPNQLPGRWSFIVSLMLMLLCARGLVQHRGVRTRGIFCAWGFSMFWLYLARLGMFQTEDRFATCPPRYFILVTVFAVVLAVLNAAERQQQRLRRLPAEAPAEAPAADSCAPLAEAQSDTADDTAPEADTPAEETPVPTIPVFRRREVLSGISAVTTVALLALMLGSSYKEYRAVSEDYVSISKGTGYNEQIALFRSAAEAVAPGENEFYRSESISRFTFNTGMLGGYNGIVYYSSTMQGGVFSLLRYLGCGVYAQNVSTTYNTSSPVLNSVFGVRYLIDRNSQINKTINGYTIAKTTQRYNTWKNPTALPLAFGVSDDILRLNVTDEVRPICNQNDFLNRLYGEQLDVFEEVPVTSLITENATVNDNASWNLRHFQLEEGKTEANFSYSFTCPADGPYYLEQNFRAGDLTLICNGQTTSLQPSNDRYKYLGVFTAGAQIQLNATVTGVNIGCYGANLYRFNSDKMQQAYNCFNAQSLQITSFENTHITGTVTLDRPQMVFTSIPQDGGWRVYCDGQEMKTLTVADALLGVTIPAGTHTLEFRYHVPGLLPGCLIAGGSLVILILLCSPLLRRLPRKKKAQPEAPVPQA